mgnify:FL=1
MNSVNLIGRPTRDPDVRYTKGKDSIAIANVSLAVDNPFSKEDKADFVRVVAFGKTAEFMEKHVYKGKGRGITGRIQTGSYQHDDGYTVYTTDIVVSNVYFADGLSEQDDTSKRGTSKQGNAKSRR